MISSLYVCADAWGTLLERGGYAYNVGPQIPPQWHLPGDMLVSMHCLLVTQRGLCGLSIRVQPRLHLCVLRLCVFEQGLFVGRGYLGEVCSC